MTDRLLGPLAAASVVVPAPDVRYTEVSACAVLGDLRSRAIHTISPAAAVIWGLMDGHRTVADIARSLGPQFHGPGLRETIELLRRLRALGLAQDADPVRTSATERPPSGPSVPRSQILVLHGALIRTGTERAPDHWTLRLDAVTTGADHRPSVVLDVSSMPVPMTDDGGRVERLELEGSTSERNDATPLEALGGLLLALDDRSIDDPDILDRLADLAEAVPARR